MDNSSSVRIGMRFTVHGSQYEIAVIGAGEIRYAASIGGKAFRMPLEKFHELRSSGIVIVENGDNDQELACEKSPEFFRKRALR